MTATQVSPQGLDFIAQWEGLRLEPYVCPGGKITIGYGHALREDEPRLPITLERATYFLQRDAKRAAASLQALTTTPLTQTQFDALASFIFNLGEGAFRESTLRRCVNSRAHDKVPDELRRWIYANGAPLSGLIRRRAAEARLYAEGKYDRT